MTNTKNTFVTVSQIIFGLFLVLAVSMSFGSVAHAQDDGGFTDTYSSDSTYTDTYSSPSYTDTYTAPTSYTDTYSSPSYTDTYTAPSTSAFSYTDTFTAPATYSDTYTPPVATYTDTYTPPTTYTDTYTSSTYAGYSYPYYSTYSYPYYYDYGYSYSYPYYYNYPYYYYTYPTVTSGGTTNTCVNNSCNTNIVNNPAPTTTYTTSSGVSYLASYGSYNNPPVYITSSPSIIAGVPNVSLSAIPYTGLDLGFWGTIAYWGFLIAWCIVAAYLIAVKRIQNTLADKVKAFLFGESVHTTVEPAQNAFVGSHEPRESFASASASVYHVAKATHSHASVASDYTDDFILAQIQRRAHA